MLLKQEWNSGEWDHDSLHSSWLVGWLKDLLIYFQILQNSFLWNYLIKEKIHVWSIEQEYRIFSTNKHIIGRRGNSKSHKRKKGARYWKSSTVSVCPLHSDLKHNSKAADSTHLSFMLTSNIEPLCFSFASN
jgi:hypothetical protein